MSPTSSLPRVVSTRLVGVAVALVGVSTPMRGWAAATPPVGATVDAPPAASASHDASGWRWGELTIDYARGFSTPTSADLDLQHAGKNVTFHGVHFDDRSFFPDDSVLPNAFIKPLGNLNIVAAVGAFTEPYYAIGIHYFFRARSHFGVGIDFTHLKIFIDDYGQRVRMDGTIDGAPVDETTRLGDHFANFNVSHGVNFLGLTATYRWLFAPSPAASAGALQPFVEAGVGPCFPHPEIRLRGPDREELRRAYSYQADIENVGGLVAAGVRYRLGRHFGLYGAYKLTYVVLGDLHFDDGAAGEMATRFLDHHVQWGISFTI